MSQPSFYVLSDGQRKQYSSHDTSRAGFHHQDLATFCEDVNSAAKRAFPNRGQSRYETANACLIRWEDDDELGVQQELDALNAVLRDYGFLTNVFLIPKLNSHWDLMRKTLDFIQDWDNDKNLFVLYYAGHGRINSARQAEWVFGQDLNSPFVDWSAIQGLFGTAKSDVLILLDTCAAASSATTTQFAVIETIAACGFERRAPPPGEYSMTNTLVDVLRDWINKLSFSAASLHTEILFRLKLKEKKKGREGVPLEWCVTPIHWINAKDCKAVGIEICRRSVPPLPSATSDSSLEEQPSTFVDAMDIDFDDAHSSSTPLSSVSSTGCYKVPHVLITLQLEENQSLDTEQTARWLDRFPLLAKWVKVEAVFPSYSTLMIMSVPLPIWDMLPDHPACSFIGYVNAPSVSCPSRSGGAKPPALSLSVLMKGDTPASLKSPGTRQLSIKRIESSTSIGQRSKPETLQADNGSSSGIRVPRDIMWEGPAREATRKVDQEQEWSLEPRIEEESFYSFPQWHNEVMERLHDKDRFTNRALRQAGEESDDSNSSYSSSKTPIVKERRLRRPYMPSSASMFTHRSYPDPKPQNNDSHGSPLKRRSGSDIGVVPILKPIQNSQQLRIGDLIKVQTFYITRFWDMGQSACREMANALVKPMELKELTHRPELAMWLPLITTEKEKLDSPESSLMAARINFMVDILRIIVTPTHQQSHLHQKSGLNVKRLEEITMEAMANWFNDEEQPENAEKKPLVEEIFKVARAEERCINGELDPGTIIPIVPREEHPNYAISGPLSD